MSFVFRAKTVEAYIIKAISEVLQNVLTDVCFVFESHGIRLLTKDNRQHLLLYLQLNSNAFDEYECSKTINIGINLQHLYKMLKSIKKKDNMVLFIDKNNDGLLGITTIQADTGQHVTSYIKIITVSEIVADIPSLYGHPIHIPTNTFQKMCKDMQSISNEIKIYSKQNFLRFSCEVDGLYLREVPFGELDASSVDDAEQEYEDIFYTKNLSQLIKISGLNPRMQIYIPREDYEQVPLKLSINTGQLGRLDIYIKSKEQIEM